jgi:hypothetical protein
MRKIVFINIILALFLTNCTSQTKQMTEEEYFEKSKLIWQNYVPKSGQSESVQGELLRAIEKLRDEAHRNGNINFNEKCHGILIGFIREKLSDQKIFDGKTIEIINEDLNRLSIEEQPYTWDDIFDRICDRIVDWNIYYGNEIKHENNSELNC